MDVHLDNPAGRLAAVLRQVRACDAGMSDMDAWLRVVGATRPDELLARLGDLIHLIKNAHIAISELPEDEDPEFYLGAFTPLDKLGPFLVTNLGHQHIDAYWPYLPDGALVRLEAASRVLRRIGRRMPELDAQGCQELRSMVQDLINEVINHEGLPRHAQVLIIDLLHKVDAALIAYDLGGYEVVAASIAGVSAGVVALPEPQRGWLGAIVAKLWSGLVSRARDVQAIGDSAQSATDAIEGVRDLFA